MSNNELDRILEYLSDNTSGTDLDARGYIKPAIINTAKQQLSNLIKELAGEEWHHNSETWCAGANARREDMLQRATNLGFNIGESY